MFWTYIVHRTATLCFCCLTYSARIRSPNLWFHFMLKLWTQPLFVCFFLQANTCFHPKPSWSGWSCCSWRLNTQWKSCGVCSLILGSVCVSVCQRLCVSVFVSLSVRQPTWRQVSPLLHRSLFFRDFSWFNYSFHRSVVSLTYITVFRSKINHLKANNHKIILCFYAVVVS